MNVTLRYVLLMCAVAFMAGCVSSSTMMTNQDGKWVRCSANGAGWLGAPMAAASHSRCIEDLQKIGYVPLPDVMWGVKVSDWSVAPAKVLIVQPGSSADVAGVKVGDVIKKIDDQAISKGIEVFKAMAEKKPGDMLRVQVERDGVLIETKSVLNARG